MYFRVNLNSKLKKPMLYCCFTWIVFIELNFTVAFLLIRKTWNEQFVSKVGGMGDFKKWEILVMGDYFEMGSSCSITEYETRFYFCIYVRLV